MRGAGRVGSNCKLTCQCCNVGLTLQTILDVLGKPSIYGLFAAENNIGEIQIMSTRLYATTLPVQNRHTNRLHPACSLREQGATATFRLSLLIHTREFFKRHHGSWLGDGTTGTYTSTADNNLPPLALRTHTYTTATTLTMFFKYCKGIHVVKHDQYNISP